MAAKTRRGPARNAGSLLRDKAFAKVNLTLRILGRRPDGYHEIESLVAFADAGDGLSLQPADELGLSVRGPFATQAGPLADNLVIKAVTALARHVPRLKAGQFILTKQLPSQAGIGGGSADAAAALRLLARANRLKLDDPRLVQAARETGADVPVCLDPRPRWMGGTGEVLSAPLVLSRLYAVLVRPDVALSTRDVFAALNAAKLVKGAAGAFPDVPADKKELIAFLSGQANDLEPPAIRIASKVEAALKSLRAQPKCVLARMSGSGSACFGLFATRAAAINASRALRTKHKAWWVKPTVIG